MNLAKKLWMTTGDSSGGGPTPSGGYVDDVFSTFTYTGNGSAQTIVNGIDLAGHGGMVWIKSRNQATNHALYDTERGLYQKLSTNTLGVQGQQLQGVTSFNSNGYTHGSEGDGNASTYTYVSWTFRKAAKFFDVVTYTGNGVAGRQIPHSLGVAPGMVIVKRTNTIDAWAIYHRSLSATNYLRFETPATGASSMIWDNTEPTDSVFTVGSSSSVNFSGDTYVAYLFAHDASADGLIQCGSFTGNTTVNIGWEPQWIMIKRTDAAGNWIVIDSMRGCSVGGVDVVLNPNLSNAESVSNDYIDFTATGFITKNLTGTHVYTVIRRPNKPPTSGTQVYNAIARNGTNSRTSITGVGFAPDLVRVGNRTFGGVSYDQPVVDRLRGDGRFMRFDSHAAESPGINVILQQDGINIPSDGNTGLTGTYYIDHYFKRAPGFLDIVCDTGTGMARTVTHGLGVLPELIIRKARGAVTQWEVWHSALLTNEHLVLNSTAAKSTDATAWNSTLPTSTTFTVGTNANTNASGISFVTYLFATLVGISKVGSYSGNGGTQTIPCGFTTGSRFILIKRIDNTGDWFVWDTARGITPTTDPHLSLNTVAAEVTTDDSIDQAASGFVVNQNAATNINALGGNYLFLAIA